MGCQENVFLANFRTLRTQNIAAWTIVSFNAKFTTRLQLLSNKWDLVQCCAEEIYHSIILFTGKLTHVWDTVNDGTKMTKQTFSCKTKDMRNVTHVGWKDDQHGFVLRWLPYSKLSYCLTLSPWIPNYFGNILTWCLFKQSVLLLVICLGSLSVCLGETSTPFLYLHSWYEKISGFEKSWKKLG